MRTTTSRKKSALFLISVILLAGHLSVVHGQGLNDFHQIGKNSVDGSDPCSATIFSENFDGVTAPALPAGWSTSFTPGPADCSGSGTCAAGTNWITDTTAPYAPPNAVFHDAPGCVTDSKLDSPSIVSVSPPFFDGNYLSFRHSFDFENGFDGGVVEISVDGGPFVDIFAAGGSLFSGVGYNGTIATGTLSPIAGRAAWTGNSNGYARTVIRLQFLAGQTVVFRFRSATDCSNAGTGWRIDNVTLSIHLECSPTPTPPPPPTSISGSISYCSNPVPGPVPNVTLTLTGGGSGSTMSDGSGNYVFSPLLAGGNYTVTPTKPALVPGSSSINTVDVIAVQRHFLHLGPPILICQLAAADVNGVGGVNTVDVIAIQRFFLGLSTGIANTGKYQFTPASRSYMPLGASQTGQNYDALILGDVALPFADRPGGGVGNR